MITLQRAKVEEVLEIKKLLYETWTATYSNLYSSEAIKTVTTEWHSPALLTKQIKNQNIFFEVAKDGEKIVGICNAILTHKGKVINIQRLHVSPKYQSQGIGSKLIANAIKSFPKVSKIDLEVDKGNHRAYAFYQKHGFKEVGEKVFEVKNVRMPCIVMEKII